MSDHYQCDCCGACCRNLIVEADYLDALREPRLLDADRSGRRVPLEVLRDEGKIILLAALTPCPFLGGDNRCGIYPTRPNVCVGFEAGDDQCQEVRERAGLPRLQPVEVPSAPCTASRP